MPYIIAVMFLVVASVGFTLFQTSDNHDLTVVSEPVAEEQTFEVPSTTSAAQLPSPEDTDIPEKTVTESKQDPSKPLTTTQTETPSVPAPTPTSVPTPTPTAILYDYKNGTYRTQSSYRTPGGQYQMEVSVTVANDIITNTSLSFIAGAGDGYSKKFSNSYQGSIIGKDLSTVRPSRIAGASLTTNAFNKALDTIRSQAAT